MVHEAACAAAPDAGWAGVAVALVPVGVGWAGALGAVGVAFALEGAVVAGLGDAVGTAMVAPAVGELVDGDGVLAATTGVPVGATVRDGATAGWLDGADAGVVATLAAGEAQPDKTIAMAAKATRRRIAPLSLYGGLLIVYVPRKQ